MRVPIPGGPGWQMSGDTLRPEITDLELFVRAHTNDRCVSVLAALFQDDTAGARSALEPMLERAPDDPRLVALEADVWRAEGKFAEAADRYRRLIWGTNQPSLQATFTQHLGKVHFDAGQFVDAAECFERALSLRIAAGAEPDLVESSRTALKRAIEEREARRQRGTRGSSSHIE